jgi:hypothetical protein
MRTFHLYRKIDETGVSGTGIVAEGIEFGNGKCCIQWTTYHASVGIYENISEIETIHGHEGKTVVVWHDEKE